MKKILRIENHIEELARLEGFLVKLGGEWGLEPSMVLSLNLVLEEALSNVIFYGFEDESKHVIEIGFAKTGNELLISIIDDGREYDPTVKPDPDISTPVEERQIGGLGIFLIKKIMDTVEYQRKEDKNHLILTKSLLP
jgi:serine/threonine-protein kinase RsbW